jgi:hypothetical protein
MSGMTGQGTGDGYGWGEVSYHTGMQYETEMNTPLIIMGRLIVPRGMGGHVELN